MDFAAKSRASSFDSVAYAQPFDPELAHRREQARLRAISPRSGTGRASLPPSFSYQGHSTGRSPFDSADSYITGYAGGPVSTWPPRLQQPSHLPKNYRQSTFFVQNPYECPSPDTGPVSLPPSPIASSPLMSPVSVPETMDVDDDVSDVSGPSPSPSPSPVPRDEELRARFGSFSRPPKDNPSRCEDASYDHSTSPDEAGHVSDAWRSVPYAYPPPSVPPPRQDHPYRRMDISARPLENPVSSSYRWGPPHQAVQVFDHPSAPVRKLQPSRSLGAPTDIYPLAQHQFQISQFKAYVPPSVEVQHTLSRSRSQSVGSASYSQSFESQSSASSSAPPLRKARESVFSFPASPAASGSSRSSSGSPPPTLRASAIGKRPRDGSMVADIPVEPESVTKKRRGSGKTGKLSKGDPENEDYVFRHLCRPLPEFNPPKIKCRWGGGCGKMLSTKHQDEVHNHLQNVHGLQLKITGEGRTRKVACEWTKGPCSAKVMQLANVFGHIKRHEGVIEFECILCHGQIDRREKMRSHCKNGECPKITKEEAEAIHEYVALHGIELDKDHRSHKINH